MTTTPPVPDLAPNGALVSAINLGNPVLAQGSADDPSGITVDLAREIARRLDVGLHLVCFDAARDSFAELRDGSATLAFLADEPARAAEVTFSRPYVLIDGVYLVPRDAAADSPAELDTAGTRIGVKEGSAYDLFLTRTLRNASVVRGPEGTAIFERLGLEAAAGIREPATAFAEKHPQVRLIDEPFMQIRQALATKPHVPAATTAWLDGLLVELLTSGFVTDALNRSGQAGTLAAPVPC